MFNKENITEEIKPDETKVQSVVDSYKDYINEKLKVFIFIIFLLGIFLSIIKVNIIYFLGSIIFYSFILQSYISYKWNKELRRKEMVDYSIFNHTLLLSISFFISSILILLIINDFDIINSFIQASILYFSYLIYLYSILYFKLWFSNNLKVREDPITNNLKMYTQKGYNEIYIKRLEKEALKHQKDSS